MKITYAIKIDDFKALRPPFTLRVGENAGFKCAVAACGLIALLGVFTLVEGMGIPVAAFLIGLVLSLQPRRTSTRRDRSA